jgi:23S rRNA (adenine2503-C2)-methyltransferase
MPITKKFPVEALIEALEYYYNKLRRRPTFEYILFEGFNDTNEDMKAFAKLSRRIPCKVNLIPFNPIGFMSAAEPGLSLKPSPADRIEAFAAALRKAGITVMVRKSSGRDINAACGQLAVTESKLQSKILEGVS